MKLLFDNLKYLACLAVWAVLPSLAYAQAPDWQAPAPGTYNYSATVTAIISIEGQLSNRLEDQVAFISDGEVVGLSSPFMINGITYHFATVFSHEPMAEIEVWVYSDEEDEVIEALSALSFSHQAEFGSLLAPYVIDAYPGGDAPILLNGIPTRFSLQGQAFSPFSLSPYLVQLDDDPVSWTAEPNPSLEVAFSGDTLLVTPVPEFFGTTYLIVRATEQTANAYTAATVIEFKVEPGFDGPSWEEIPGQYAPPGSSFMEVDLAAYETQYSGSCLDFAVTPVLDTGMVTTPPAWAAEVNTGLPQEMSIVARAYFTPSYMFNQPGDLLVFRSAGVVRGVAAPTFVNQSAMFFATVYNEVPVDSLEVQLYSAAHQRVFDLPVKVPFSTNGELGSAQGPYRLDFSPFNLEITAEGILSVQPQSPLFKGAQYYTFEAADCDYPALFQDTVSTYICYDEDTDEDGLCDALDPFPTDPCAPDNDMPPLWVLNAEGDTLVSGDTLYLNTAPDTCGLLLSWRTISAEDCALPVVLAELFSPDALSTAFLELVNPDSGWYELSLYAARGWNELSMSSEDETGNRTAFVYYLAVADSTAPVLSCHNYTAYLDSAGTFALAPFHLLQQDAYDNCSIDSLWLSTDTLGCNLAGTAPAITLSALDPTGNLSSCTVEVTVLDTIAPSFSCTDIAVEVGLDGSVPIAAPDIATDISDNCGIDSTWLSVYSFACGDAGVNAVMFTALDVNGNSASCMVNVEVSDPHLPEVSCNNLTVYLDEDGAAAIVYGDVLAYSDNCGTVDIRLERSAFGCMDTGAPVSLGIEVEDPAGNLSSCTVEVTVLDTIRAALSCTDVSVEVGPSGTTGVGPDDIIVSLSDNCGVDSVWLAGGTFDCASAGTNEVTVSVLDVNGNLSSCTIDVSVSDPTAPSVTCLDIVRNLSLSGTASVSVDDLLLAVSDNCSDVSLSLSQESFDCSEAGTIVPVVLSAEDPAGNVSSCTASVQVRDVSPPQLLCTDVTKLVGSNGAVSLAVEDVVLSLGDNCGVDTMWLSEELFNCSDAGINEVSFTAVDVNGNTSSCSVSVEVVDPVSPQLFCTGIFRQLNNNGERTITPNELLQGYTDNCMGELQLSLSQSYFDCSNAGQDIPVVLTAEDEAGNISSCEVAVSIRDTYAPEAVCMPATVELGPDNGEGFLPAFSVDGGSTDNCVLGIELELSQAYFTCDDAGVQEVELYVRDASGNESSCTALVEVIVTGELSDGWQGEDIGAGAAGGVYAYTPCSGEGLFSVSTPGSQPLSSLQDELGMISREMCGNFEAYARVVETNGSYGGLMVRESSAPDARYAALFTNWSQTMRWEVRTNPGGGRQVQLRTGFSPRGLYLRRTGYLFRAYYQPLGSLTYTLVSQANLFMPDCVEVGMAAFRAGGQVIGEVTFGEVFFEEDAFQPSAPWGLQGGSPGTAGELKAWPNPARNSVQASWGTPLENGGQLRLLSQLGQAVLELQLLPGEAAASVPLDGIAPGLYYLSITGAGAAPMRTAITVVR